MPPPRKMPPSAQPICCSTGHAIGQRKARRRDTSEQRTRVAALAARNTDDRRQWAHAQCARGNLRRLISQRVGAANNPRAHARRVCQRCRQRGRVQSACAAEPHARLRASYIDHERPHEHRRRGATRNDGERDPRHLQANALSNE